MKNNRYEYEDKRGKYLYPKRGAYDQFIKEISDQYTILTDGENAKFTNMLSAEHVRQLIKEQKDSYCLEYCARDKSRFFIMSVIPVEWEGGYAYKNHDCFTGYGDSSMSLKTLLIQMH